LFSGKVITGYTTYADQIEKELNETRHDLSLCEDGIANANNDIASFLSGLANMKSISDVCRTELNSTKSALDMYGKEKSSLQAEKDGLELKYNNLAIHAATDMCCVRGVKIASWSIVDDFILCSGNKTINCTG
jgi:chromosome segregation ATPase